MQFLHILSLLLLALVAYTSAQNCNPNTTSCSGGRNVGRSGRGCLARNMWYYDARLRQCREMRYLGCGGNRNRWCTRIACVRRCHRR
ncbi:kunitz-type serine protease inhibitor A-like [Lucilia cuprina]|uniref:kunitz-type serine protease inhibitor A-like n=1 Tax=Lucilia cuprina TaxID=7375 RepID=UPI001F05A6AC|nr:kunitz-type serine protease inhibitor A-like [Lucilia cuprina]